MYGSARSQKRAVGWKPWRVVKPAAKTSARCCVKLSRLLLFSMLISLDQLAEIKQSLQRRMEDDLVA